MLGEMVHRGLTLIAVPMLLLSASCARTYQDPPSEGPPSVVRLVCTPEGTRLGVPTVVAQPDGVHLEVENRTDIEPGFAAKYEGGGLGRSTPPGTTQYVEPLPPGRVDVGCFVGVSPTEIGEPDFESLTVLDPEGHYVMPELECRAVKGGILLPEVTGDKGEVRGSIQDELSGRLNDGDAVRSVGYPHSLDTAAFAVQRGEETIALFEYRQDGSVWALDSSLACPALLN